MKPLISKCSMMPAWHQLVPISGHVEESETARKLQLYATSIKTSVSTRLLIFILLDSKFVVIVKTRTLNDGTSYQDLYQRKTAFFFLLIKRQNCGLWITEHHIRFIPKKNRKFVLLSEEMPQLLTLVLPRRWLLPHQGFFSLSHWSAGLTLS